MTKIETVLEAIHAIEAAIVTGDPMRYLLERDTYATERVEICVACQQVYTEYMCDENAYHAAREIQERQEELIFLRLARELLPVIAPLLAPHPPPEGDEL